MWFYSQATGELTAPSGSPSGFGFAGQDYGLNNPEAEKDHNIGPLPKGSYTMTKWIQKHDQLGLCVIELTPDPTNEMYGRSGFFIHGSRNLLTQGLKSFLCSSEGCIVYGDCASRLGMWNHPDKLLKVI